MSFIKKNIYYLLFLTSFSACSNTKYLIDTSLNQWQIFNRAIPIEDALKNPYTSSKTKEAILLIQDIKKFSVEELGLEAMYNYNTYVQLDAEFVNWVIIASHPIYLKPREWKFPIIGKIPYIGFFTEEKAKKYLMELKKDKNNWYEINGKKYPPDVHMRGSNAYSTLGWFSDPIYSSMISKSIFNMANITIHESVHSTFFIPSQMAFNERIASFIGLKGSLKYIQKKYGVSHEIMKHAKRSILKNKVFYTFINEATSMYKKTIETKTRKNTNNALQAKKKFFKNLPKLYSRIHRDFGLGNATKKYTNNLSKWNNANMISHGTYLLDFSPFEKLYNRCNKDLKLFIQTIKRAYKKNKELFKKNPEQYVQDLHCS